jgi:hypothetical protein
VQRALGITDRPPCHETTEGRESVHQWKGFLWKVGSMMFAPSETGRYPCGQVLAWREWIAQALFAEEGEPISFYISLIGQKQDKGLTPSRYGRIWSQKNPHVSTMRARSFSSSISMSFEFSVSIPFAMSSEASPSSLTKALEGDEDTTVCIWRFTRLFRSSL